MALKITELPSLGSGYGDNDLLIIFNTATGETSTIPASTFAGSLLEVAVINDTINTQLLPDGTIGSQIIDSIETVALPRLITTASSTTDPTELIIKQGEYLLIGNITSLLSLTLDTDVTFFKIRDIESSIQPVNVLITLSVTDSLLLDRAGDYVEVSLDSNGDWSYYNYRNSSGGVI